jgi:hypothetical protein
MLSPLVEPPHQSLDGLGLITRGLERTDESEFGHGFLPVKTQIRPERHDGRRADTVDSPIKIVERAKRPLSSSLEDRARPRWANTR